MARIFSSSLGQAPREFFPGAQLSRLQIPAKQAVRVVPFTTAMCVRNKAKILTSRRGHAHRIWLEVEHQRADAAEERVSPREQGGLCLGIGHNCRCISIMLLAQHPRIGGEVVVSEELT